MATPGWDAPERNVVVIAANPYSGSRANRRCVGALASAIEQRGLHARVAWTPEERSALLHNPAESARCRCVVAAGGDGTVTALVNERPPVPLAVLPLGSENLFARELGFTRDADTLADRIAVCESRRVDLGCVGEHRFTLMVGVGIDADIVHRMARWRARHNVLKRVTRLSYAKPILDAVRRYPFPEIELEADGMRVCGIQALVFNVPRYAAGLQWAPDARSDDGCLDWVMLEKPGSLNLLRYAWAARRNKLGGLRGVRCGRARLIRITSSEVAPVHVDGDPHGTTPVVVTVLPRELSVV